MPSQVADDLLAHVDDLLADGDHRLRQLTARARHFALGAPPSLARGPAAASLQIVGLAPRLARGPPPRELVVERVLPVPEHALGRRERRGVDSAHAIRVLVGIGVAIELQDDAFVPAHPLFFILRLVLIFSCVSVIVILLQMK